MGRHTVDDDARPRAHRSRFGSFATATLLAALAVAIGVGGAGVTSALLTASATQQGATITAGTAALRIDGDSVSSLGARALSPAAPAVWSFTVTNTGDVPLALSGAIGAPTGPAYRTFTRALLAAVPNAAACTASLAGTPAALDGYVPPALGTLAAGSTQRYCLVLSVPTGTSAAGTGSPLSFTLTVDGAQTSN